MVSIDEAIAMVPFLRRDYMAGAFYDPACWDMEVESILQGYLRAARRNGADIRTGSPVSAVERDGGIYRLVTPQGPILARRIVNATGAWADRMAELAGLAPLGIVPHRRTAITVDVPPQYDLAPTPGVYKSRGFCGCRS